MNKGDLINFVKEHTGLGKTDCEKAVNAVFESISSALQKKEDATFFGFGTFTIVKREAREGRNPQTGAKLQIAATSQVKFSPGKTLKERRDKKKSLLLNMHEFT